MNTTDRKDLVVLVAMFGVVVLTGLWSVVRQPPAAPVSPEVAFSPQTKTLLNDILDKEHARQVRLHRTYPMPDAMMNVNESALLNRKDEIVRAASTKGDHVLAELLTTVERWEKNRDESNAPGMRDDCRKNIEHLLEQNGLGPVILLPG